MTKIYGYTITNGTGIYNTYSYAFKSLKEARHSLAIDKLTARARRLSEKRNGTGHDGWYREISGISEYSSISEYDKEFEERGWE